MSTSSEDSDSDFLELSSLHSSDGNDALGMYDTSVKPFETHQPMMFVTVGVYDHILDPQKESAQVIGNLNSSVINKYKPKTDNIASNTSVDYYSRLPLDEAILSAYITSNNNPLSMSHQLQSYDPLKKPNIAILAPSNNNNNSKYNYNITSNSSPNESSFNKNISIDIPSSNVSTAYNSTGDNTFTTDNSNNASLMPTVTDNDIYEDSIFCSYGNINSNDDSYSDNPDVVAMLQKNGVYDNDVFHHHFPSNSSNSQNEIVLNIGRSSAISSDDDDDDDDDIYTGNPNIHINKESSTHQKRIRIEKRQKQKRTNNPLILSKTSDCSIISIKLGINHSNRSIDGNMTPSPSSTPATIKGKYLIEQNSNHHGRHKTQSKKSTLNDAYMEGENELVIFSDLYNSRTIHHSRTLPIVRDIQLPKNRHISTLNPRVYDICIVIAQPLKIFYESKTRQQSTNHRISIRYDVQHLLRSPLEYLQSGLPDRSEVFDCLQQAFTRANLKMRSANFIGTREKLSMIDNGGGCKILQFVGYACNPIQDAEQFSDLASTIHVNKNESHILLEDDTNAYWFGEGRWISQTELGDKLDPKKYDIVIAMSPQHTRMAQIFTDLEFKYVLAIETAGNELRFCESKTATFLRLFYSAILNQQSIGRSFDLALAGTNGVLKGKEQSTYILYTPQTLKHSSYIVFKQLMSAEPETHHSSVQYPTEKTNIVDAAIRPFIGRASQIIKILQLLSKGKILVVKGCELIGRSTIIHVVCRYLLQHGFFTGGCFVIDCKRISNHKKKHFNFSEIVFKTLKECGIDFNTKVVQMVFDNSEWCNSNNASVDIQLSRIPEGRPPKNRYDNNSGDCSTYSTESTDQIKIFEENGELQMKMKNSSSTTFSSSDLPMNFQKHSQSLLEVLDDILGHQSLCMIILNPKYWPKEQEVNEFITNFNNIMSDESRCMVAMDSNVHTTQLWDDMGVITLSALSPSILAKIFCKFVNCGRRKELYTELEIEENEELQMIFDGRPGVVAKCASFVKMFMSETGVPTVKKIVEEFPKCNIAKNIRIMNNCSNNSRFSSTSSSSNKLSSTMSFNSSSDMNTNDDECMMQNMQNRYPPNLQNISENRVIHHLPQYSGQPFRYSTIEYNPQIYIQPPKNMHLRFNPISRPPAIDVCMPPSKIRKKKKKKQVAVLSSIPSEHSMYGSSPAVKCNMTHSSKDGSTILECQSPAYHKHMSSSMNSSRSIEWENSIQMSSSKNRPIIVHIAADNSRSMNGNQSNSSTNGNIQSGSSSVMNYLQNIIPPSSSSAGSWSISEDCRSTQLVMNHSYNHSLQDSYHHSFQNSFPLVLSPVNTQQQQFLLAQLFPGGVPNFQCDQSLERQHTRSNLSSMMGHSMIAEHDHNNSSISYRRKKVKQRKFTKRNESKTDISSYSYPTDEDDDGYTPSTSLTNKNTTVYNKSISLMNINSNEIPFEDIEYAAVLDDDGHVPKQKKSLKQKHNDGQHPDLYFNQSLKNQNSIQRPSISKEYHSRRVSPYNITQSKTSNIATLAPPLRINYSHFNDGSFGSVCVHQSSSTNIELEDEAVEAVVEHERKMDVPSYVVYLPSLLHNSYSVDIHHNKVENGKYVAHALFKTHSESKTKSTRINKRLTNYSHAYRIWNKSTNVDGWCYLKNLFPRLLTFFRNETLCKYQFPRMIDLEHFFLLVGGKFGSEVNDGTFENIPLIEMQKFSDFFSWFRGICDIVYDFRHIYDINNGQQQMECLFYGCSRAEEILKTRPIGTFILRLESQRNIMCISLKKKIRGKMSKICHLYFERKSKDIYLRNGKQHCVQIFYFIRNYKLLNYFYTPLKLIKKNDVF